MIHNISGNKNNQCIKLNHSSFIGTKLWWLLTFKWNDFKAFFLNKQAGTFNTQICEKYAQCSSWRFIQFPITEPKHINTNTRRNTSVCRFTWLFSSAKAHSPDCPHLSRAGFHVCVCVLKTKADSFRPAKPRPLDRCTSSLLSDIWIKMKDSNNQ